MDARERELLRAWQRSGDLEAAARLLVDRERRGLLRASAIDAGALAGHAAACLARGRPQPSPPDDVEAWVRAIGAVDDVALALAARAASASIIAAVIGLVPQPSATYVCPDTGQTFRDPVGGGGESRHGPQHAIPAADRLLVDTTLERRADLLRVLWIAPRIADEAAIRAVRASLGTWLLRLPGPRDGPLAERVATGELTVEGIARAASLWAPGATGAFGRFHVVPDADAPLDLPAELARRGVLGLIATVAGAVPALQPFVAVARATLDAEAPSPATLAETLEPAEERQGLVATNGIAAASELARALAPAAPPVHLANALAFARAALHAQRTGTPYATAHDRTFTHTSVLERVRAVLVAEGRLPDLG